MNLLKTASHKLIFIISFLIITTNCIGQKAPSDIYNLAYTAYEASSYNDAIEFFNSVRTSYQDSIEYHLLLGICQSEIGDNVSAIESYANCIALDPNYDYAFFQRGISYFAMSENAKSLEDFNKAISITPDNPEFYLNLGTVKYSANDKEGACKAWSKASELGLGIAEQMIEQACK